MWGQEMSTYHGPEIYLANKVNDDHIIFVGGNALLHCIGHFIGAHLRLHIEGSDLGRVDQNAILAFVHFLDAAVEEVGHVGILLSLSDTQLLETLAGQVLTQNLSSHLMKI